MFRLHRRALFMALLLFISQPCASLLHAQQKSAAKVPAQDDEVVRVETDLTNILLTAIDKNKRFVTTLQKQDLRVYENDTPQEIFTFQRETDLPLSLVVLIDVSRSQAAPLPEEQAAALSFVRSVIRPEKDAAAVVSFTGNARIEQPLTNDLAALKEGIERLEVKVLPNDELAGQVALPKASNDPPVDDDDSIYSTAIWDALNYSVDEVLAHTRDNKRRAIILVSDGDDTSSKSKREEAIEKAIKANVVIYSIGIGSSEYGVEKKTLRKVSEQTGGTAFFPQEQTILSDAFKQIEQELRSQYLLAYAPSDAARDGSYRRIRLDIVNPELRKQKLHLLYRQGYYARQGAK